MIIYQINIRNAFNFNIPDLVFLFAYVVYVIVIVGA